MLQVIVGFSALASYNFKILYRPGKCNSDADGLSRLNHEELSSDSIKAICQIGQPYAETLAFDHFICQSMQPIEKIGEQYDIATLQNDDPSISFWKQQVILGKKPERSTLQTDNDFIFHRNFSKLRVRDDILLREVNSEDKTILQHVIPASAIPTVLSNLHNKMGHLGRDKTLSLVRQRFYCQECSEM